MKCKTCGAAIIWVKTKTGKDMPVDVVPSANGNLYLSYRDGYLTATHEPSHAGVGYRYTSHFATCPQASLHRQRETT